MTFSFKRTFAIFQKDYKDISKNLFVSSSALMPLFLAALYGRMGMESAEEIYLVFNLVFCLVGAYFQCTLIAEEKEKNTLRGLMLSPASTIEILTGKSMVSFIGTIAILIISALFMEYNPENFFIVSIALVLSAIFYIAFGTLLGLVTKSVMEASLVIVPFFVIFSFGSMLTAFKDKYPFLKAVEFMPNNQLIDLANDVQNGGGFADSWTNLGIILLWGLAIIGVSVIVYKKRMTD